MAHRDGTLLRLALLQLASTAALAPPAAQSNSPSLSTGSYLRAADYRIAAIAYKLGVAGKQYCPSLLPLSGLLLHHLAEYDPATRGEASTRYGLDRGPGILAVLPDSPAARGGVAAGDVLLSVNAIPFPSGLQLAREQSRKKWRKLADGIEEQIEGQLRLGPARLQIVRHGREMEFTLHPILGCPSRARLARSSQPNAFADGRTAIVTTKLLTFIRNDDELAIALAHEIAHNVLQHPARLEEQKVPHGILRNFGKNAKRVRITEEEADRLSIKLLWSAGYDLSAVIPFWRRVYATYSPVPTPKLFSSHPSLRARERIVHETLAELSAAQPAN